MIIVFTKRLIIILYDIIEDITALTCLWLVLDIVVSALMFERLCG